MVDACGEARPDMAPLIKAMWSSWISRASDSRARPHSKMERESQAACASMVERVTPSSEGILGERSCAAALT